MLVNIWRSDGGSGCWVDSERIVKVNRSKKNNICCVVLDEADTINMDALDDDEFEEMMRRIQTARILDKQRLHTNVNVLGLGMTVDRAAEESGQLLGFPKKSKENEECLPSTI